MVQYCYFQRSWEKLPKWPTQFGEIFSPFFLSNWGDSKSKGKVKKKFPENFGAFYPSENGPLGERLLNVTMHFSCLHLYVICDVVAHDWIHWIKLALRHFGKFWDPFSQWRWKFPYYQKAASWYWANITIQDTSHTIWLSEKIGVGDSHYVK